MTSLYMYYVRCFVLVENSVCHKSIPVLINMIYIYTHITFTLHFFYVGVGVNSHGAFSLGTTFYAELK